LKNTSFHYYLPRARKPQPFDFQRLRSTPSRFFKTRKRADPAWERQPCVLFRYVCRDENFSLPQSSRTDKKLVTGHRYYHNGVMFPLWPKSVAYY